MASIAPAIAESVRRFLIAMHGQRRVLAAYVYGSHARGAASEWSDIDLAVVSPDFTADRFQERVTLMRLAATIDSRIEPHPFRPDEFTSNDPLAYEVQRTGIQVM